MGISMNAVLPSKWLKAEDITQPTIVTMKTVTMEEVGQGDHKPVLWLEGYEKGVVLNKTNAGNISGLYGDNSDGWVGRQMEMTTTYVDFQGQSKLAIRLYPPRQQSAQQPPQTPAQMVNAPLNQGDPRGNVPSATSEDNYGAVRG